MSSEKVRKLRQAAAESEDQVLRRIQESGELQHLHGQPLDLSDDSPQWFANKLLRREGYSHPLIERGREVDEVQREVDAIVEPLRRYRARLTRPGARTTPEQAGAFNERREEALEEYRTALAGLNRAILFHNLGVPETLHRRPYRIDDTVARAAREIPPIERPEAKEPEQKRRRGWRLWS